jgi:hypothetical protein
MLTRKKGSLPRDSSMTPASQSNNVLQPGKYRLVRSGHTCSAKLPKILLTSRKAGHARTGCNGRHRIVALEKVAGSNPVGHPLICRKNMKPDNKLKLLVLQCASVPRDRHYPEGRRILDTVTR